MAFSMYKILGTNETIIFAKKILKRKKKLFGWKCTWDALPWQTVLILMQIWSKWDQIVQVIMVWIYQNCFYGAYNETLTSRKHAYIILTPLNPTFI